MTHTKHLRSLAEPEYDKTWLNEMLKTAGELKDAERKGSKSECWEKYYRTGIEKKKILDDVNICWITTKPSVRTEMSYETAGRLDAHFKKVDGTDLKRGADPYTEISTIIAGLRPNIVAARMDNYEQIELITQAADDHVKNPDNENNGNGIYIINSLCDTFHPMQSIADIMTIRETMKKNENAGKTPVIAYLGDGNNVCNSLIIAALKAGIKIVVSTPKGYEPLKEGKIKDSRFSNKEHYNALIQLIKEGKDSENYVFVRNPKEALDLAKKTDDVVFPYTDTWISMGDKENRYKLLKWFKMHKFRPYRLNEELYNNVGLKRAYTMHDQPIHEEEISTELARGTEKYPSIIVSQGENRIYVAHSVIAHQTGKL